MRGFLFPSRFPVIMAVALAVALVAAAEPTPSGRPLPRTIDGKPDLEGIWQASGTAAADLQDHAARYNMPAGLSVVGGAGIPYQPWAAAKKMENFQNRGKADPLAQCFMPGVPRIMYLDFPFQIFQTPQAVAIAFEWSLVYRLIHTDGSRHPEGLDFWMGDSRGRWEGDTLVVDVANNNDKTWFDLAGDFHTDALHVVERYRMTDPATIQYEATIEDSKAFTKPWTISLPLHRRTDLHRILEYACQAEAEEASGAFEREERTWYPGSGTPATTTADASARKPATPPQTAANVRHRHRFPLPWINSATNPPAAVSNIRTADGKPNLQGFYEPDGGGANYGLSKHVDDPLTPGGRGVLIDPPDGTLPMLPWAVQEKADRNRPERGYDDPTAHCFVAGIPRSMYIPSPFQIIQTSDYIVFLHERMAWRIVSLNRSAHLPDDIRLWQGDSVGAWEGDTLVVETSNLNGKTWLNEVGEIVSYAERVVERFTPAGPDRVNYAATVTDPLVYSRPWTIAFPLKREKGELLEAACHEEDQDLAHLKAIKDAAAAGKK